MSSPMVVASRVACDNLQNRNFDEYVSFDVPRQAADMSPDDQDIVQSKAPAGSMKASLYTVNQIMTKENIKPGSCFVSERSAEASLMHRGGRRASGCLFPFSFRLVFLVVRFEA